MKKALLLGLVAALLVSAPANAAFKNNDDNLKLATAISVGNDTAPESITLSEVKRGMLKVTWKATAPSGKYTCQADDMLRKVLCLKDKT